MSSAGGIRETSHRPWFTTAFGAHYPLLYPHRDRAEAERCLELLPRLAPLGPGPVLDLGCGTGRHLAGLAQAGVPSVGLDLSPALLAEARRLDPAAGSPLVRADMRSIPLRDESCTAVLSLFTSFGYFGPPAAHAPVVAEVARILKPDGHWYLDFLNSRLVRAELAASGPAVRERETAGLVIREERRLESGPDRVVKRVELRPVTGEEASGGDTGVPAEGLAYIEEVTLLELAELDALATAQGLVRETAAGNYEGAPLDADRSPRWLLVYRREGGT